MRTPMRSWFFAAGGLVVIAAAAGVAAYTDDTADRPAIVDEDPGPDPLEGERRRTIATGRPATATDRCGPLPRVFENPVAEYRVCLPDEFGFLDLESAEAMQSLDRIQAASVRIAGPEAFPWVTGTLPLDAVAAGATIIEVTTVPTFDPAANDGDCRPDRLVGSGRYCTVSLDPATALPDEQGSVRELLAVYPLLDRELVVRAYLPGGVTQERQQLVLDLLATAGAFSKKGAVT